MSQENQAVLSDDQWIDKLSTEVGGVSLSIGRMGTSRKASSEAVNETASNFNAESEFVKLTKKIVDTKNEQWKAVRKILSEALTLWRRSSTPYPADGVRLIRRDKIESFSAEVAKINERLTLAVAALQVVWPDMIAAQKESLGRLYDESDYDQDITGKFSIVVGFPSLEPPDYLKNLSPALYEQQVAAARAKIETAVSMAETALLDEVTAIVQSMTEMLDETEGKKQIRSTSVGKALNFVAKFRELNITNNAQLNQLVNTLEAQVKGIDVKAVKKDVLLASELKQNLKSIGDQLASMVVDTDRQIIL